MRKENDLTSLVDGVLTGATVGQGDTISQQWTFANSVSFTPISLNRVALSYGYMAYGLVQSLIEIPVEDAFRGGVDIITDELSSEEVRELKRFMDENHDFAAIKTARKWARLFGGGALLAETDQDEPSTPLSEKKLKPETALRFVPADRWELILTGATTLDISRSGFRPTDQQMKEIPFMYYAVPIHKTRVTRLLGREAPSFVRLRLQGWGMSELERCMRSINSFIKFQNMIFELIDEAKIDVFKIQQFNEALATAEGTELINKRIALNAQLKNYRSSTVMDAGDDFSQKQITWSGLAEIYQELRQNLSSDLMIPEAKLFGQSSSGFSSGQDTIENYNSLVERERDELIIPLRRVIDLRCQQLYGFVPDYTIKFKTLRVLSDVENEQVNTSKTNRNMTMFHAGLLSAKEVMDTLDKEGLLLVESEVQQGLREVDPLAMQKAEIEAQQPGVKQTKEKENALLERVAAKQEDFVRKDKAILSHLKHG